MKKNLALPKKTLVMIFALHYTVGKKTESKSIKQSLKKNASFKAFAFALPEVPTALTSIGILDTERRMVRRKRGRNGLEIERSARFFITHYNAENTFHNNFLE